MRTIEITADVKNPEVIKRIKEAKAKKQKIHELLAKGVRPSDIPADLKISLKK